VWLSVFSAPRQESGNGSGAPALILGLRRSHSSGQPLAERSV